MTPTSQVIRRRESDNNYSQDDPSAMWYRFAGRQMGLITDNGGWEGSYAASVAQRQAAPATTAPGAFADGALGGQAGRAILVQSGSDQQQSARHG
ncbi:MAG: hypothetical protein ACK5XZ_10030 [Hyphomonadaceae bacterium]|nr:hypothetical protein [Hyphomonadaceae bacterium]MCZ8195643.1 hypothetical protein [Aquidulcibacter sp.]